MRGVSHEFAHTLQAAVRDDRRRRSIALSPQPPTSRTGAIPRDSKTAARSALALASDCSRCPEISCESAEVRLLKSGLKSAAHEFRTKSAQSGGLETNGRRDGISCLSRRAAVRRFVREARGNWASMRARRLRRMFAALGLAEGEELETNILRPQVRRSFFHGCR